MNDAEKNCENCRYLKFNFCRNYFYCNHCNFRNTEDKQFLDIGDIQEKNDCYYFEKSTKEVRTKCPYCGAEIEEYYKSIDDWSYSCGCPNLHYTEIHSHEKRSITICGWYTEWYGEKPPEIEEQIQAIVDIKKNMKNRTIWKLLIKE
jgi:hypothetical protein